MQTSPQFTHLTEQQYLSSEVLAFIVWRLFPNVTLVGGGVNSLGFYYDFVFEQAVNETMFELIEVEMYRFTKEEHSVRYISMMRENAQSLFEHHEHFLLGERAAAEASNIIDLVQIDDFYGLCPPLSLTGIEEIGHIRLLDSMQFPLHLEDGEVNVTRLIGTSRGSARDLKDFSKKYDSFLKKRDHRALGPKLNLFSFDESLGELAKVIWHPKGQQLKIFLLNWLKEQISVEIDEISTPLVAPQQFLGVDLQRLEPFDFEGEEYRLRSSFSKQHLDFLRRFPVESCELPRRVSESAQLFRHISEPHRWGLLSQCAYLGEQTTICCLRGQVNSELISSLHFIEQIITMFDFEAQWYLVASRQKTPKGKLEQEAVNWLKGAMQAQPRSFPFSSEIQEEEESEGARLELRIRDVLGREWPVSFLGVVQSVDGEPQVDSQPNGKLVVLTQQVWGSLDRLIALLVERYEGRFPLWLAPEQVRVMAIGEANQAYARQVSQRLQQEGLRVKLDIRQSKLGVRVHEAEKEHVPYLVLIGEQERIKQKVSVRSAEKFNQSQSIDIETLLKRINQVSFRPMSIENKKDIMRE